MKVLATLATATLISLASLNVAQASDDTYPSVTVQFADLDLDKPQGVASLFARIKNAARTVCSRHEGAAPQDKMRYKACIEFAVSNAVARVDEPQLSDYFASRAKPAKAPERLADKR